MHIPPHVHIISTEFWGRQLHLILLEGDGLFLIDTGLAGMPRDLIFPYMRDKGLSPTDMRWMASTHAHADHMGGNAEIQSACPGIKLGCHELDRPWVESHELHFQEAYQPYVEMGLAGPELRHLLMDVCGADSPVDVAWAGGEMIPLGDWTIEVVHAPGHTLGNLVFLDRQNGLLIEGETILGDSSGEPGKKGVPVYADVMAYRNTLRHLMELPWEILLSSHAAPRTRAEGLHAIRMSLNHVDRVHEQVIDTMRELRKPAKTHEVAASLSRRYGWALDLGLAMVTQRHLEYLARTRQVVRRVDDQWEWIN